MFSEPASFPRKLHLFRRCYFYFARSVHTSEPVKPSVAANASNQHKSLVKADQPNSEKHSSLSSFLAYASRVRLPTHTSTYVGTHYEYIAKNALSRLGFSLTRLGGRLDQGIDLLGHWQLPASARQSPLRVLVQCKALARKPTPSLVRELEGTFVGAPAGWQSSPQSNVSRFQSNDDPYDDQGLGMDVMAILVTPREATKGVRDALGRSRWPLGFAKITLGGKLEQLLWNKSASERGLEGVGVTMMITPDTLNSDESGRIQREVKLTWMGETLL